jgi:hypothetical protein
MERHGRRAFTAFIGLAFLLVCSSLASAQQRIFRHPQPGEVYKEYVRMMDLGTKEWRVNWPLATDPRAIADFPNAVMDLNVDDLQNVTRAELIIDLWGGHAGTIDKQIRFNGKNWLNVPDLTTVPGSAECYVSMRNVTIDIPVGDLVQGTNYFEGNCGGQTCNNFQWGLWGWYGVMLRVYYSPSKPHASGTISSYSSGGALPENPTVAASVSGSISRVDFLAYYDGYDEDGDGFYQDYHQSYHRPLNGNDLPLQNHVGSATGSPWQSTWNTDWVPDQAPGSVKLLARICDANGYWYVTPEVNNLTLQRTGKSIRMYHANDVPTEFQTRASNLMTCHITIPDGDNLGNATAVQWHMRTWNGKDGGELDPNDYYFTKINGWTTPTYGNTYFYAYDVLDIPVAEIRNGSNTIEFFSTSMGHGIELLWPGPSFLVKYVGVSVAVTLPLKVFLEGPFASGSMSAILAGSGVLPLAHPYAGSPWNHGGTESVTSIPADVVDWVLVELRTGPAADTKCASRAAFVKTDGSVVDVDGTSPVRFNGITSGSYYVVVRHRNHIPVMSAAAVALSPSSAIYDFTTDPSRYYGGDARQLASGAYGMYAGDADGSGDVSALDRTAAWNSRNQTGYVNADVDLSGDVSALDRTITWNNRNVSTKVP